MSDWTYIRGVLGLSLEAFERKPMNPPKCPYCDIARKDLTDEQELARDSWRAQFERKSFLPFPKEQFKIDVPKMEDRYHEPTKEDPSPYKKVLATHARVFSLPRAKPLLEQAFNLLPQGECGFRYAIKQDSLDFTSSIIGVFEYPCLKKYFKDAINDLYKNDHPFHNYTFEELQKYQGLEDQCSVDYVNEMTIGIIESLRWCVASELQKCLEEFFLFLIKNDFEVETCLLEWNDNVEYCLNHTCRCDGNYEAIVFETVNTKTNEVIYRKTIDYPRDKDGYIDFNSEAYDNKTPVITEEILGEAPVRSDDEGE